MVVDSKTCIVDSKAYKRSRFTITQVMALTWVIITGFSIPTETFVAVLVAWVPGHSESGRLIQAIRFVGRTEELKDILPTARLDDDHAELQTEFRQRARQLARMLGSPVPAPQLAAVA